MGVNRIGMEEGRISDVREEIHEGPAPEIPARTEEEAAEGDQEAAAAAR